jgi:mannose-6-phosphate isomerase
MNFYPFKLKPIYKERIWGGRKLQKQFGKKLPEGKPIGESWELADLPEDKSTITNGEFKGKKIDTVIKQYSQEITGKKDFKAQFPLLIKILDAQDVLSLQVHPDSQTCRRTGQGDPKTECWYIIQAEKDAVIYKGLKEGVSKEQFRQAVEKGTTADLLKKIPVQTGQCHFLPAGTAHAVGAGLLIAEIQTPSDTTYRVFDWNRTDSQGKTRQLHIDQALESIHFDSEDIPPATSVGRLVDCEYFTVDKGHNAAGCEHLFEPGNAKAIIFIKGKGTFQPGYENEQFKAGDCWLIPACYKGALKLEQESEYLIAKTKLKNTD